MLSDPIALSARRGWSTTVRWAALWVGVFGVTFLLCLQRIVIVRDEVWMLWVASRLARGEVLYREVYDVTTPLAAWLAALAVRVAGVELAVVRALSAAVFATEVVLAVVIARRFGLRRAGRVVLVVVLLAVAAPYASFVSLYSGLAITFGLATFWATVRWADCVADGRGSGRAAVLVGVLGAAAFWSKPNVGAFVALAVGAVVLVVDPGEPWRARLPDLARIGAGALGVSAVCLLAVVATGAFAAFTDQVFASKGEYVRLGFGYLPALTRRVHGLLDGTIPFEVRRVTQVVVQASPLLLLGGAAVGTVRARRAPLPLRVAGLAFTVAGLLSLLPRPGLNHITGVLPLVLVGVTVTWALGNRVTATARPAARFGTIVVGAVAVAALGALVVPLMTGEELGRPSRAAVHFRGTPVNRRQLDSSARLAVELRSYGVRRVFITRNDAGFLYLRTGTTDPLPFDIVERSDLGGADESGVIRRLARGDAEWVCVRKPGSGGTAERALIPRRLEAWVRAHFDYVASLARCDLYRDPSKGGR